MVLVGILWIPVIQGMQGAQLFFYIQAISAYLAPPIASVYLLAVLWPRANERVMISSSRYNNLLIYSPLDLFCVTIYIVTAVSYSILYICFGVMLMSG